MKAQIYEEEKKKLLRTATEAQLNLEVVCRLLKNSKFENCGGNFRFFILLYVTRQSKNIRSSAHILARRGTRESYEINIYSNLFD